VETAPAVTYFKPQGVPLRFLDEVRLPVEGLEAIRLKDVEGLHNEEAARRMGVSRATFERVLGQARQAVAEALIEGKALRVEGGDYDLVGQSLVCAACGSRWQGRLSGRHRTDSGECPSCRSSVAKEDDHE
jgi:predicted DNA-binding protein (UPF0251 family)